jgi:O-methyltransferase
MQQWISSLIRAAASSVIQMTGELPSVAENIRHAPILPSNSTYSPWLTDVYFQIAMRTVEGSTLVDPLRCYELWTLVRQSQKLGRGALLEVGAWRGGSGCIIAKAADLCGIAERVYLCDTFQGLVKAGAMDTSYKGGEYRAVMAEVEALVHRMNVYNVEVLSGTFPDETGAALSDKQFRFAHIDVKAYQSTKDILDWLWPRLVPGGMVVLNDYGTYGCEGVTRLANELASMDDRIFVHNLNGHGVFIKREGREEFDLQARERDGRPKALPAI